MKRFTYQSLILILALCASACAPKSQYLYFHPSVTPESPESLLDKIAEIEKEDFDNIKTVLLAQNKLSSHHLVVIKKAEPFHSHPQSDLWAMALKGEGEFVSGDKRFKVHPGSNIYVPRGVPHKALATGKGPIAALVIFTPPYEGKDTAPVAEK